MKACSRCGRTLPLSAFSKHVGAPDGLQGFCRECSRWANVQRRGRGRREIHAMFGSRCARCGNDDWRVLEVDHINGGGTADRLAGRVDQAYTRRMVEQLSANRHLLQLLCANCHRIKTWEDRQFEPPVQLDAETIERNRAAKVSVARRSWWANLTPEERSAVARKGAATRAAALTHCLNGHPFDEANTHIAYNPDGSVRQRVCRACRRDIAARGRARRASRS